MKTIIERVIESPAEQIAEKRELKVNKWIGNHWHIKKLFFHRWLFLFADMKGFSFEK